MIHPVRIGSPGALLALQTVAFLILTAVLFHLFATGKEQLFLGAIVGGIFTFFILHRPHLGVVILLAVWLTGFSPRLFGARFLTVPYVIGAILFFCLGLAILRERGFWAWRVSQIKILFVIGILFFLSTWWNYGDPLSILLPHLDLTERLLQDFITRFVFLIFFIQFINTRRRIELLVLITLGVIVAAAWTGASYFLSGGGRARAAFSLAANPNRLAFICVFATSLLWFYRSLGHAAWLKSLMAPLLFLLPTVALATGSRSGFLQLLALAAIIIKEQEGWSPLKRARSFFLLGSVALLLFVAVPAAQFMRATTFDPTAQAPGKESLNKRIVRVWHLLDTAASNPIFGIGIGNFGWFNQITYGDTRRPHNSYLGALAEGGIGVLALYLLLFYVTYQMLRQLERAGPPELLWLSKGLRVGFILFLIFSAFADFWYSDFLYVIVGLAVVITRLSRYQQLRSPSQPRPQLVPVPTGFAA